MPASLAIDILGWGGCLLYLFAYLLLSLGRLDGRSVAYQSMNLVAAVGVAVNAFHYAAYPSTMVNVAWFLIAALTLGGVALRSRHQHEQRSARDRSTDRGRP